MSRLTKDELQLILRCLGPYRDIDGVGPLMGKIRAMLEVGAHDYMKVVRVEFVPRPGEGMAFQVAVDDRIRELEALGCAVLEARPPLYVLRVPDYGEGFNATIDLLESLHRHKRIRYRH